MTIRKSQHIRSLLVITGLLISGCASVVSAPVPKGELSEFSVEKTELSDGNTIALEKAIFTVPLNNQASATGSIELPVYRLRAIEKTAAAPIFLLAGGPGSSWVEQFEENEETQREALFYSSFADVIIFDQRGGGKSKPDFSCEQRDRLPFDRPITPQALNAVRVELSQECITSFQEKGVDLSGLNTPQNSADVEALRRALGYDKVSLIGGSYGSHLALHLMRSYPKSFERVVMYGVEGPDHTYDNPDHSLATLQRIAAVAEASPELKPHIAEGGLLNMLAEVIARLEAQPVEVIVKRGDQSRRVVLGPDDIRLISRVRAGRRSSPNFWPELIISMYEGDFSLAARGAMQMRNVRLQDPMHYMMDCASGISEQRSKKYERSASVDVFGDLNLEYTALCSVWPAADLGQTFNQPVRSDIPTLIIHGTWDMSTPIQNAREVVSTLENGHLVEVVEGTHGALYNLYEHWPPMREHMKTFLVNKKNDFPSSITMAPVEFNPRAKRSDK